MIIGLLQLSDQKPTLFVTENIIVLDFYATYARTWYAENISVKSKQLMEDTDKPG